MSGFEFAMTKWENQSDPSAMIALLEPFADDAGLDIEQSGQKGCDCTAIEIQGCYVHPFDDGESGDAIMLLLSWLSDKYEDIQLALMKGEWTLACFKGEDGADGPSYVGPLLIRLLLEAAADMAPNALSASTGGEE